MALEALRNVLLQVSNDFARQKFHDDERALARSEQLSDREDAREYQKAQLAEARKYAKELREEIKDEHLKFIFDEAKARAEAERKLAPTVEANTWMARARAVGASPFDPEKPYKPQYDLILAAEDELFQRNLLAKKTAEAASNLAVGNKFLDQNLELEKKTNAPAIEKLQGNLADIQKQIVEVNAQMDADIAALEQPIRKAYALATTGKDPAKEGLIFLNANTARDEATKAATIRATQIQRKATDNINALQALYVQTGAAINKLGGSFRSSEEPTHPAGWINSPVQAPAPVQLAPALSAASPEPRAPLPDMATSAPGWVPPPPSTPASTFRGSLPSLPFSWPSVPPGAPTYRGSFPSNPFTPPPPDLQTARPPMPPSGSFWNPSPAPVQSAPPAYPQLRLPLPDMAIESPDLPVAAAHPMLRRSLPDMARDRPVTKYATPWWKR